MAGTFTVTHKGSINSKEEESNGNQGNFNTSITKRYFKYFKLNL
jgi:hypothetical protein